MPSEERPQGMGHSVTIMWIVMSLTAILMVFEVALSGAADQMFGQ